MSAFDSVRAEIEANGLYDPETGEEIVAPIDPPYDGEVRPMLLPTWDELTKRKPRGTV